MKILSITLDPEAGGSSKSLLSLAKELKKRGHNIVVVIPREGYLCDNLIKEQIPFFINKYLLSNVWPQLKSLKDVLLWLPRILRLIIYLIPCILRMNQIIKKINPTIIHSNSSIITTGFISAKINKKIHVWHIREYVDKDFGLKFFPNQRFRNKILKSSPSISITKEINETYSLQASGVVIYNGVGSIHEQQQTVENNITLNSNKPFIYIGSVTEYKGVTDLIKAYCKYYKDGGRRELIICGSFSNQYYYSLLDIIKNNKIKDNQIIFKNQVDDVSKYMQNAYAIIIPSIYEAFGRVSAEAMFNNCVIIARNTGGLKEQLDLGKSFTGKDIGLRFNSIQELVEQMKYIDNLSEQQIKQMTDSAYLTAQFFFTIDKYVNSCIQYFEMLIQSLENVPPKVG